MLGKNGRALKCASCGHSWYQSAQAEDLDLAAIMGEDCVQKAQAAAAGGRVQMRNEVSSPAANAAAAKRAATGGA